MSCGRGKMGVDGRLVAYDDSRLDDRDRSCRLMLPIVPLGVLVGDATDTVLVE